MTHYNLVHKCIPMPQAMKILDAKNRSEVKRMWKNGKNWRTSRHGSWRKSETKTRWSLRQGMSAASLMDLCHLKNPELEPQFQKYEGRVVFRGDSVKDDSGAYALFTERGSSASQMTAAKIMDVIARLPGCGGQAADAVSAVHSGKIGGCSQIAQNFKIRMSRCFDTSSTTQMAKIMRENWTSRGYTSWMKLVRSSICWIAVRKTIPRSFTVTWMGENSELGMYVRSSEALVIFLSVYVDGHQNGWKEAAYGSQVEEIDETCDALSVQTEWNNHWTVYEDVWVTYFCWSIREVTGVGKTSSTNGSVVRRHGRTWSKRRWPTLRIGKQLCKVSSTLLDDHQFKQEELESVRELSEVCSQLVLQKLVFGTNWTTWHLVVSQQACEINHKMDSGMWQTLGKTDILHSSHKRFPTVLSCGKHGTALQTRFVSRLRFCWRSQPQEACLCWKQNICPSQLDVQKKTNSSTESKMISLDARLRMYGLLAVDLWDMVIEVLRSTNNKVQPKHTSHQEAVAIVDSNIKTQHVTRRQKVEQLSEVDCVPTNTHSSQGESQLYIFEDNEAVIKMIIKGGSPTMRHVSRTRRVALDWLFARINLDPKIQNKYIDTKNQLADILSEGSFSKNEWNHLLWKFTQ